MSISIPTPGLEHPPWCSPDRCEVRPDVLGDHRSEPVVIEPAGDKPLDGKISVWLSQFGYEDPATAEVFVNLRFTESAPTGEIEQLATYILRLRAADQLSTVLAHAAQARSGEPL